MNSVIHELIQLRTVTRKHEEKLITFILQ